MYWQTPWHTQSEMYLVFSLGVVALFAVALFGMLLWQRLRGRRLHDRVGHLSTAMALLTDTLETSLNDVSRELAKLSAPSPAPVGAKARSSAQRRVRSAAKLGHSVPDIAASEEMSEGEVRLMLQMSPKNAIERANHADLR
jgi:hypothetical protein